jgi:hypothetical protein
MIHAKVFVNSREGGRGNDGQFNLTTGEEGSDRSLAGIEGGDRPLIVQVSPNFSNRHKEPAIRCMVRLDSNVRKSGDLGMGRGEADEPVLRQ